MFRQDKNKRLYNMGVITGAVEGSAKLYSGSKASGSGSSGSSSSEGDALELPISGVYEIP